VSSPNDMIQTPIRIPALPREEWTDEVRDVYAIYEGENGRQNGSKSNVIMMLARHPDLARAWLTYNKQLLTQPLIPARLREIAILRVAAIHRSEYEWVQHVMLAKRVGMVDSEIAAIRAGDYGDRFDELESFTLAAVDQMLTTHAVDDATWAGLARHLDQKQLLELMFVIGTYSLLSLVFNATGIELEAGAGQDSAPRSHGGTLT
jgi:4-carboxymuconolactone decarboxylase